MNCIDDWLQEDTLAVELRSLTSDFEPIKTGLTPSHFIKVPASSKESERSASSFIITFVNVDK
jgi:hypothetical protein